MARKGSQCDHPADKSGGLNRKFFPWKNIFSGLTEASFSDASVTSECVPISPLAHVLSVQSLLPTQIVADQSWGITLRICFVLRNEEQPLVKYGQ